MAVPKKRLTKRKTRQRRSHHALTATKLGKCSNCNQPNMPHQVCTNCGAYRGKLPKEALDAKKQKSDEKTAKKEKKN